MPPMINVRSIRAVSNAQRGWQREHMGTPNQEEILHFAVGWAQWLASIASANRDPDAAGLSSGDVVVACVHRNAQQLALLLTAVKGHYGKGMHGVKLRRFIINRVDTTGWSLLGLPLIKLHPDKEQLAVLLLEAGYDVRTGLGS